MRGLVRLCAIVGLIAVCMTGCQSYEKMLDNHEAVKMQNDGVWEERYMEWWEDEPPGPQSDRTALLSVDVLQDMTEEQMFDVLEYYELFYNALLEGDVYTKEREAGFTLFAAFYKGKTDEPIRKIKYVNHESVEITQSDEYQFVSPVFRSKLPKDR